MARIVVPVDTLVGSKLIGITNQVNEAAQLTSRALSIMNQISNSGQDPTALETSSESMLPEGTGAMLYAAVTTVKGQLDQLAAILAAIDKG